jgi:hypothetical protein
MISLSAPREIKVNGTIAYRFISRCQADHPHCRYTGTELRAWLRVHHHHLTFGQICSLFDDIHWCAQKLGGVRP